MSRPLVIAALVLTAPLAAQSTISLLEGPTPTALSLRAVPEATPAAAGRTVLGGIEILDVEITNRTQQQQLRTDRPRRQTDGGLPRIELPGNGRLLRYRDGAKNRYGLVWVDATGDAHVVLEIAGLGGGGDPFLPRFGVANDGQHAAIATTGGALWVVRLDGGTYASTGSTSRMVTTGVLDPRSICVGTTHLWAVTAAGALLRCPLSDGGVPSDVTPSFTLGSQMKETMAPAGDGMSVCFLYGPKHSESLWQIGTQGAAVKLPPPPAHYEEPAYLPDVVGGPLLALNDDGTRLLYTDATSRDEIYVLDTTGATPTTQLTSDANFEPYIGTGVWPSFVADVVTLAIGDVNAFDWIDGGTASPLVSNITLTAPQTSPPFSPGVLVPTAGYRLSGGTVLTAELVGGSQRLRAVDPLGNSTGIVANALRDEPALGRGPSGTTVLVPSFGGDLLVDPALQVEVQGPAGVELSPESAPPGGGWSVLVARVPAGPAAAVLRLAGGALLAIPDPALSQALATPGGNLVLDGVKLVHLAPGATTTLSSAPLRFVLSRS